jgi:hypothetical protein
VSAIDDHVETMLPLRPALIFTAPDQPDLAATLVASIRANVA